MPLKLPDFSFSVLCIDNDFHVEHIKSKKKQKKAKKIFCESLKKKAVGLPDPTPVRRRGGVLLNPSYRT